jgi:hypothetical protein
MTENFRLVPEQATAAANDLNDLGERLRRSFGTLIGVLDEHDGCWGEDDIGKAFEQNYVPHAKQARESARQAIAGIVDLAASTKQNIDIFQDLDYESARRIDASTGQNS